jgi:phosphohistidine phosphatase
MKSESASKSAIRRLLICRHAKSSWQDGDVSDFARTLNKRGERDAPEMGRRLVQRGIQPDLILTSPATRAQSTAMHYAAQLGCAPDVLQLNPAQYAASPSALLAVVQGLPPQMRTVLLVGHNPESTVLANALGGLAIDNIPTCGVVALEFVLDSWRDLKTGKGALLFFDFPKNHG